MGMICATGQRNMMQHPATMIVRFDRKVTLQKNVRKMVDYLNVASGNGSELYQTKLSKNNFQARQSILP